MPRHDRNEVTLRGRVPTFTTRDDARSTLMLLMVREPDRVDVIPIRLADEMIPAIGIMPGDIVEVTGRLRRFPGFDAESPGRIEVEADSLTIRQPERV